MSLYEILFNGSGLLVLLLTLIEIAPIKINPWTKFAEKLGAAFNKPALNKIAALEKQLTETQHTLEGHLKNDALEKAESARDAILRFNNELLRNIPHTREEFFEVLRKIDVYEDYCDQHKDYENNRAVHAVSNINRVYDTCLIKHNFTPEVVLDDGEFTGTKGDDTQ